MDKHPHYLVIADDLFKGLKVFIMNRQGDLKKGDLSKWTNIALKDLIQRDNSTRSQITQLSNPFGFTKGRLRIKNLMYDICSHHLKNYDIRLERGKMIHLNELREAIIEIMNYHDVHGRALQQRMKELLKYKYLSDKAPSANLFIVLNNGSDDDEFQQRQEKSASVTNEQNKEFDSVMEGLK